MGPSILVMLRTSIGSKRDESATLVLTYYEGGATRHRQAPMGGALNPCVDELAGLPLLWLRYHEGRATRRRQAPTGGAF